MTIIDDFKFLKKHGFAPLPYALARSEKEVVEAGKRIGYPLVLKVVSPEIIHKTDVGGVIIGIKNRKALRAAYNEIMENTRGKKVDGVLVQKKARKGIELIIGGKKDEQFGHLVVIGLGGIYVEVFRDISARICPISREDVKAMIMELKSHPIIMGTRGRRAIHIKSLEDLVLRICRFMERENVSEMDLNPVIFNENGYDIIDVRFRRAGK